MLAPLVVSALVFTAVPLGMTVSSYASAPAAPPKPPTAADIKDIRKRLIAMSAEVGRTKAWVEEAEAKLPAAQAVVDAAEVKVAEAQDAVERAEDAVAEAKAKVAAQQEQIRIQQKIIDNLLYEVSKLARRSYIQGGEYQALEMIMGAASPADYANQKQAIRRVSSENARTYDKLLAAKLLLTQKLEDLKKLEEAAAQRELEAQAKAKEAGEAREEAVGAKQAAAKIVNARNAALVDIESQLGAIRGAYEEMLAQYEAAHAGPGETGSTRVPGAKVEIARSGRAVVDWAMQYVGKGDWYDGLCLGFVDDAYGAESGRMPRAIDQWYRAKDAGLAHPDDRTPPVGAQVFWWSPNDARHIALYVGGGMVISTGVDGGRVGIVSMEYLDSYGPYLGWAPGYYG